MVLHVFSLDPYFVMNHRCFLLFRSSFGVIYVLNLFQYKNKTIFIILVFDVGWAGHGQVIDVGWASYGQVIDVGWASCGQVIDSWWASYGQQGVILDNGPKVGQWTTRVALLPCESIEN